MEAALKSGYENDPWCMISWSNGVGKMKRFMGQM